MKKSPPKTAFYKVTTTLESGEDVRSNAVVVEASSWSEAAAYIADRHITVEEYPVDKLVAYIKAGGEPIKVPVKAKRPYAKKTAAPVKVAHSEAAEHQPA